MYKPNIHVLYITDRECLTPYLCEFKESRTHKMKCEEYEERMECKN